MNEEVKGSIKKYVRPSIMCIALSAFFLLMGIGTFIGAMATDYAERITFCIIAVIFVIASLVNLEIFWFKVIFAANKKIEDIEQQGKLEFLADDFLNGNKAFKDSLRFGRHFLIGKNKGTIVSYGEIVKIYPCIHKTNGIETQRDLKVVTDQGKILELCNIPLRGKGDNEMMQVISYIKSINNNIAVGYSQ